jgi:hypothetical protein
MKGKTPLSVAIITKNEATNLPDCLAGVAFADQVVVVDSCSTDDTVKIAAGFGCDVFSEPWRGFGPQKTFAIYPWRNPLVLVLAADYRIPAETADVICGIVSKEQREINGYRFPRRNWFQGRWVKHLWGGDRVVRLFRKGLGRMTPAAVHESVEVDGVVKDLDVPIEHYTESDLSKILIKIDHYSTLGAREAFKSGRRSSIYGACGRAALTFFQDYFLRLGFLDGPQGLTLAVTDAVNKFCKYAKLSALHKQVRSPERSR